MTPARTGRLLALAGLAALAAASAGGAAKAGDAAELEILGFSNDGGVFAFEEYGIQDGSGFPYANRYYIDTDTDTFLKGTPIRVRIDDETASLADARRQARDKGEAVVKQAELAANPGFTAGFNAITELSADPYRMVVNPRPVFPAIDKPLEFRLDILPFGEVAQCHGMGEAVGLRLLRVDASDGARPLEPGRWYARLAQKVMALLSAVTAAGRLYDIDVRLRPDGGKGALVSSLASYTDYQRERAWTWEHQALVRARGVAGDAGLLADFEQVRAATLGRARDAETLFGDVLKMRARMRTELDRSDAARLDLKQGAGGLVDLEFLLQTGVLAGAARDPALCGPRETPCLIDALAASNWLSAETASVLHDAHATLLDAGLSCTLDRRPRITVPTAEIETACAAITAAAIAQGLPFEPGERR